MPSDALMAVRRLLDAAFDGGYSEDDWHNALGGKHIIVRDGEAVVSHAAVVQRRITVNGRTFRTGYVEGVATAPGLQGRGLGSLTMDEAGMVIRAGFEMGALSTDRHSFYERLGWQRWRGPTFVRDGDSLLRSEDEDDGVMVLPFGPSARVDPSAAIACEARTGDDW